MVADISIAHHHLLGAMYNTDIKTLLLLRSKKVVLAADILPR
jgi:hypothetical protein